jgi:hypothetical protein
MKFLLIDPEKRRLHVGDFPDLNDAKVAAGLKPHEVDHSGVARRLTIVVYEYSMFVPPAEQFYFSAGLKLFGGPAVIYQTNEVGETVDFDTVISTAVFPNPGWLRWYRNLNEIEAAISGGTVKRPQNMVNEDVIWSWNR